MGVARPRSRGWNRIKSSVRVVDNVLCCEVNAKLRLNQSYHFRMERPTGRFERRFEMPDWIDRDKVTARIEEGILTVTLPKKPTRRRLIRVPSTER